MKAPRIQEATPMQERLQFYIDGQWVDPIEPKVINVINPATEEPIAKVALGGPKDVDRAVTAARKAFESFSRTSKAERVDLLKSIVGAYQKRYADLVQTVSKEMGARCGSRRPRRLRPGSAI